MKIERYKLKGTIEDNLPLIQGVMRKHLHEGVTDIGVRRVAEAVVRKRGIKGRDYLGEIKALTSWVRSKTRFTRDPYGAELIRHPRRQIYEFSKSGQIQTDCDESSTLLASLLGSIGHNVRVALVDAGMGREITHAIAQVEYPPGRWIFLETTKEKPIGWSPKFSRMIIIE